MPLLERDDALAFLDRRLHAVAGGAGGAVLLSGEAGIGKSAAVERFVADQGRRARILVGACDGVFTPRPLGPLMDIASDLGGRFADAVRRDAARPELFDLLRTELSAGSVPTVFVIEDAHWADEATLDMLLYLCRRIVPSRVLVVVTYRDDGLLPAHPLRRLLGEVATFSGMSRLRLAPLSEAAVAVLAAGSGVDPAQLSASTGGNPFFVTEVLATGGGMPPTVRDAVLARVGRLSRPARDLLEAAALVGLRTDAELLGEVVTLAPESIEECLASGILRVDGPDFVFRHDLSRLAVEETVSPLRRVALHRGLLAALWRGEPAPDLLPRLAYHAEGARDSAAVLELAPAAAARAAVLGAHREAAEQYGRTLRAAGALPVRERARYLELRAYQCYLTDQMEQAIEDRVAALVCWRQLGDGLRIGDNLRWISRLRWFQGRKRDAEDAAREAVDVLQPLPPGPELAMAYSNRAHLAMLAWDADAALAWGDRAIVLAERLDEPEILAHALNNVGTVRLSAGDGRGLAELRESLRLARENGFEEHVARALTNLGSVCVELLRLDAAEEYLREGIAYSQDHDLDAWYLYMLGWSARVHLVRARWDEAIEDAMHVLARPAAPVSRIQALTVLGLVRARRGDPQVWPPLDEALAIAEETGELQRLWPVRAARAEAAWLEGRAAAAAAEAETGLRLAREHDHAWALGELACWCARARDLAGGDVAGEGVAGRRDGLPAGSAGSAESVGSVESVGSGVLGQRGTTPAEPYASELAGDWRAAAARWRDLGCSYDAALALSGSPEEADLRAALDACDPLGARPLAARLARALRSAGARSVPRGLRPTTRANPANLTNREVDVLLALTAGLTDAGIAERLHLSRKTVSHHVSSILRKLDVASRGEAAARALGLGL